MNSSNRIVIVTGLSGAGRTTALKIFEDIGFEAVDNLPVFLLPSILESKIKNDLAIGVDVRSREFNAKKISKLVLEKKKKLNVSILFFDCETDILVNRFKESRRIHPLKLDLPISHIIERERSWLDTLKRNCDFHIDTSGLTPQLLRKHLDGYFSIKQNSKIYIRIISFGLNMVFQEKLTSVFDMRFIKNPFMIKI